MHLFYLHFIFFIEMKFTCHKIITYTHLKMCSWGPFVRACSVIKSCLTLWPHGLQPARLLQGKSKGFPRQEYWRGFPSISFSSGSSWPRDQTHVSCVSFIEGRFFTVSHWYMQSVVQPTVLYNFKHFHCFNRKICSHWWVTTYWPTVLPVLANNWFAFWFNVLRS